MEFTTGRVPFSSRRNCSSFRVHSLMNASELFICIWFWQIFEGHICKSLDSRSALVQHACPSEIRFAFCSGRAVSSNTALENQLKIIYQATLLTLQTCILAALSVTRVVSSTTQYHHDRLRPR